MLRHEAVHTTEVGEKATQCGKVFAASSVFFHISCISVLPPAIYYLGTLRIYPQNSRLLKCPGSKSPSRASIPLLQLAHQVAGSSLLQLSL